MGSTITKIMITFSNREIPPKIFKDYSMWTMKTCSQPNN